MNRWLTTVLVAVFALLGTAPGHAHRPTASGASPVGGIEIPSLTHGQMVVISDNLSAIRKLASARIDFDMTTWRLEDYLNLQSFACLWGIVPGSIADDASPFNECGHAYLAAARALLLQLRKEPHADRGAIDALVGTIEAEMLINGSSLTLCRFSDEPFNTNQIVYPHWSEVPRHPPTATLAGASLLLILGGLWRVWPRRSARGSSVFNARKV